MKKQILNEEFRKMQKLAGINENNEYDSDIYNDIEADLAEGGFESKQEQIDYLQGIIDFCQEKIASLPEFDDEDL
jgi:hypothetical protein